MIDIGRRWVPSWLYNSMPRVTVIYGLVGVFFAEGEAGLLLGSALIVYGAAIIFLRGRL